MLKNKIYQFAEHCEISSQMKLKSTFIIQLLDEIPNVLDKNKNKEFKNFIYNILSKTPNEKREKYITSSFETWSISDLEKALKYIGTYFHLLNQAELSEIISINKKRDNKPKLAWSIEHPDTNGVYKIYRSVWENGDYSGQTAVWPPVVTVNSWTDEDFTRFRFGNYTIDYEVAYLSLPPNESEKSNQVTTTTGNWSGPLGKTRADKYTLNIFPNPFNSSVTIPLNEEIHTVSIYNILGETIKKYSHVDLISKNQIVWNGLDKYGNEVSTGTYFVILVSDNKIQTRKVVFAK